MVRVKKKKGSTRAPSSRDVKDDMQISELRELIDMQEALNHTEGSIEQRGES